MGGDCSKPSRTGSGTYSAPAVVNRGMIRDCYETLDDLQQDLRKGGLESSNLIVAIDYTKSNEWTGKMSFNGRCLHATGAQPNPYESAIRIITKTLSAFDDDQMYPCYGFGDVNTGDSRVFSFKPNDQPCRGLEELQQCYRALTPSINLSGPTSFAPAIRQAIKLVSDSGNQYHILLLIADGQVTRPSHVGKGTLSTQEKETIDAIVQASEYPLSIVMVGVGDGPWDQMEEFDDAIPERQFDNFQFVNFTEAMARVRDPAHLETHFALNALMEIPEQFQIIQQLGLLRGRKRLEHSAVPAPLDPPVITRPAPAPLPEPVKPQHAFKPSAAPTPTVSSSGTSQPSTAGTSSSGVATTGATISSNGSIPVPPIYFCPITHELMRDPVLAADGYTYENEAIKEWLRTKNTSPMTNARLTNKNLTPNHALRSSISEFRQKNPSVAA